MQVVNEIAVTRKRLYDIVLADLTPEGGFTHQGTLSLSPLSLTHTLTFSLSLSLTHTHCEKGFTHRGTPLLSFFITLEPGVG